MPDRSDGAELPNTIGLTMLASWRHPANGSRLPVVPMVITGSFPLINAIGFKAEPPDPAARNRRPDEADPAVPA